MKNSKIKHKPNVIEQLTEVIGGTVGGDLL